MNFISALNIMTSGKILMSCEGKFYRYFIEGELEQISYNLSNNELFPRKANWSMDRSEINGDWKEVNISFIRSRQLGIN